MTSQQKKELHEQGNHIAVVNGAPFTQEWSIHPSPVWDGVPDIRLIHKKHSHILEAYLDGCEIYTKIFSWESLSSDFIESYNETQLYLAVPKSLENCYCEANELHLSMFRQQAFRLHRSATYISTMNYISIYKMDHELTGVEDLPEGKQIEWSTQIQNWVYCQKEDEMEDFTEGATKDGTTQLDNNTISDTVDSFSTDASMDSPKLNNFNEYGFTAVNVRLRGTIYEEVYCDRGHDTSFYGKVFNLCSDAPMSVTWDDKGICSFKDEGAYDLTPIVKEVYPMFKKDVDGTVVKYTSDTKGQIVLTEHSDDYYSPIPNIGHFIEDSAVPYYAERDLYHGQPCFINWHETHRIVFYIGNGIFRDRYQDYNEGFGEFYSYRQIPLKTLQHMSWVWEQYKALEL